METRRSSVRVAKNQIRIAYYMRERLHKFLADCGIASRRKCEQIICRGDVSVNGRIVTGTGITVDPETDDIFYKGRRLRRQSYTYMALYKPAGIICSCRKDKVYKRVIDIIPSDKRRLYPVGRLDVDSEGLILLTNDGDFCYRVTHPKFGIEKEYIVWLDSLLSDENLAQIRAGVVIDNSYTARVSIKRFIPLARGCKVYLELYEGKNREIRKLFAQIGKNVWRLRRIRIGNIKLGKLRSGEYRLLNDKELNLLRNRKVWRG